MVVQSSTGYKESPIERGRSQESQRRRNPRQSGGKHVLSLSNGRRTALPQNPPNPSCSRSCSCS